MALGYGVCVTSQSGDTRKHEALTRVLTMWWVPDQISVGVSKTSELDWLVCNNEESECDYSGYV